jgi:hypothetical protein
MLSNLSDLLLNRISPDPVQPAATSQTSMMAMSPQSQGQASVPQQAQYLQAPQSGKGNKVVKQPAVAQTNKQNKALYLNSATDGKPTKTPQAVLDWLNQMENNTGYFAEQPTEEIKYVSPKSKHLINTPGPIWTEYKTAVGGAKILEGMRLPDGSIDRSHPDVGMVDYGTSLNPSGAVPDKTIRSRALKNEKGNWVYRNPVNPNKTHEYIRTGDLPEEVQYLTQVAKGSGWNMAGVDEFSMTPEQRAAIQAKQDEWARRSAEAQKAKNSKPVKK